MAGVPLEQVAQELDIRDDVSATLVRLFGAPVLPSEIPLAAFGLFPHSQPWAHMINVMEELFDVRIWGNKEAEGFKTIGDIVQFIIASKR